MKLMILFILAATLPGITMAQPSGFRPPAVPRVTHDPYFSIWSFADRPQTDITRHWTGKTMGVFSMVSIDGACYRLLGPNPPDVPAMDGGALSVTPTSTSYVFDGAGVSITLTFLSPLLPDSLELLSRPLTYVTWSAQSTDGKPHAVKVYLEHTAELCINTHDQDVAWGRVRVKGMDVLRMGSSDQKILGKPGDDLPLH